MSYKDLELDIKYRSEAGQKILNNFYIPVLSRSKLYYRAVGYFTSNILIDYIKSLEKFVASGGKIRLLISPVITKDDLEAIEKALKTEANTLAFLDELIFKISTYDDQIKLASDLLAILIYNGVLSVKIALPKYTNGIFHEKIGIFEDFNGNRIAISGSNNETHNAINANYESFNVFCDWELGQKKFVDRHLDDFYSYWNNTNPNLTILEITEDIVRKLKPLKLDESNIKKIYDELNGIDTKLMVNEPNYEVGLDFTPHNHQEDAVRLLNEKHRGILKFATGSGKTKATILFLYRYYKKNDKSFTIVVVPDKTLVIQWEKELKNYFPKVEGCDSDHNNWRKKVNQFVNFYCTNGIDDHFILVSTINTYSSKDFQELISKLTNNYIFIADECHVFGTENGLKLLPQTEYRIGLSATPEIYFNPDLTSKLFDYFNGILLEYTLEDAIREKKLVKYNYYPVILNLNSQEKNQYEELTKKLVKLLGKEDESEFNRKLSKEASMLLFKRSRIIYSASSKLDFISNNVEDISSKRYLLIYCGVTSENENDIGKKQITSVNEILSKKDIVSAQYTESENGEARINNIESFKEGTYKVLVAIKCLDQGVDIPEIERAIIMSSTTNPREFIQRRGRLLRTNGEKKKLAEIYDLIILEDDSMFRTLNKNELSRLKEFAYLAENRAEIYGKFNDLFEKYLKKEKSDD